MAAACKVFRWFFFCGEERWCPAGQWASSANNYPADRWRLLCWIFLHTFVWSRTSHTLFNFVAVIFLICCVGIAVTAHTMGNHDVRGAVRGFFALLVINVVNGGLILVTSHRAYIAYEHLLRKLLLKESELRIMGIPSTYVTIFSVTMATLIIRGIHRELFHKPKQQQH
ncbi:uncharacterized protein LOC106071797 [Biomphalaria glabrata]|uniref:Uncharacterized protein LOC106071797 n=1 Tax=Biomphalaria glabrata TaxID=6526 RepID=A0A9W3BHB9_BIOGL|nr:uncharacterized protein LOC106071797 [Biomphalaria glabrata]